MTYVKFTNKYGYKECRRLTEEYTISDLEAYGITDVEEITAEEYKEWLTESRVKAMRYDDLSEMYDRECEYSKAIKDTNTSYLVAGLFWGFTIACFVFAGVVYFFK